MLPIEYKYKFILPEIRHFIFFQYKITKPELKQENIAKILDISPSALSQYKKGKRASLIELSEHTKDKIRSRIAKDIDINDRYVELLVNAEYRYQK